jgi:LmbE family N-acetylglucosaminyl deacetylase
MKKKILVIAAHADDEVLGCGGTIAKHSASGDAVYALFMTDGVAARTIHSSDAVMERRTAAIEAAKILGLTESIQLDFPDNRMDSVPLLEIVKAVEGVVRRVQPDTVYTHHAGDLNIDHKITHQAAITACRPFPGSSVREIYAFEILSSTEWASPSPFCFLPTVYVDISDFVDIKKRALVAYSCEMHAAPHSRSIEHVCILGKHRGNCVGVAAAEAFEAIRIIK